MDVVERADAAERMLTFRMRTASAMRQRSCDALASATTVRENGSPVDRALRRPDAAEPSRRR